MGIQAYTEVLHFKKSFRYFIFWGCRNSSILNISSTFSKTNCVDLQKKRKKECLGATRLCPLAQKMKLRPLSLTHNLHGSTCTTSCFLSYFSPDAPQPFSATLCTFPCPGPILLQVAFPWNVLPWPINSINNSFLNIHIKTISCFKSFITSLPLPNWAELQCLVSLGFLSKEESYYRNLPEAFVIIVCTLIFPASH